MEFRPERNLGAQDLEQQYQQTLSAYVSGLGSGWDVRWQTTGKVKWCQLACKARTLPAQGWKIHLSASAPEAVELCHDVLSWLLSQQVACKIVADLGSILRINSGCLGDTQTGKILTVYPCGDREVVTLAMELDRRWPTTAGPAVPSDLAIRANGAVFLRYGAFGGESLVDRFGKSLPALRARDGTLVEDRRSADGRQPEWAPPPPVAGLFPAVPTLEGPWEIGSESYLPLLLLHTSPRSKIFLGLTLSAAEDVVVKVRRRGVGGGLAAKERLDTEYHVLRALNESCGLAPRPLGYLKGRDFELLAMEYVDGQLLSEIELGQQLLSLPELARALARLHATGFVHGDVKLSNAILTGSSVRLLDFELAAPIGSQGLALEGTHGHIPPELGSRADAAVDVYALGACISHAFLGYNPAGLPAGGGRLVGLLGLFGHWQVARIVKKLLDPRPEKRPTAANVALKLENLCRGMTAATKGEIGRRKLQPLASPTWCLRVAREAAVATRDFRESMPRGHAWRSRPFEDLAPAEGINLGSAGVILGLTSIDWACRSAALSEDVQGGAEWLASRPPHPVSHGFFTGNAGVSVALGVAGKRFGRTDWTAAALARLTAAAEVKGDCDFFSGAAGVLWAACVLAEILEDERPFGLATTCGDELLRLSGVREGVRVWPREPGEPPLTGAAHGSAGIALALAVWGRLTGRPEAVDLALETFQRIFRNGREGPTLRYVLNGTPSLAPILQWCHGIAGYIWCMLLAFGDDRRLKPAIDWSLERCAGANVIGNPIYCHGIAGELELWRLVRAYPRLAGGAVRRAERAASVLRLQLQRHGGLGLWGTEEDPEAITPDLWVGFLGPATALALYACGTSDPLLSGPWLRSCASPPR